ncbi:MAG TPA: DUF6194 family protein [Longimicrobium sp.]|nr:DUF6194 family protein [Longimicrobium sp.]
MDEAAVARYITENFDGLDVVEMPGATFFFHDPERSLPPEKRLPFATIVTTDDFDQVSNLGRPGVFRLNLGVARDSYRARFGAPPRLGVADPAHDYTALDRVLPHPVYAAMSWICVLNPSEATFEALRPLIAEAYEVAVGTHAKLSRGAPSSSSDEAM